MKLFICSFLLLFHVNFVSTLSTAIDNGSETSFSTFLTTLPKIAETKQVNGKIALLTDGVVNLDVDSVFYLEVYDEKIDNNEEGIFFCFKAKKESTIPGLKKCPKNYCDVHVRYSNYTGKVISAFVLMGDAKEILFSERTKTEIRESTMAVNAGQTTSRACTWDYSSGYLPVELMNKQHRKVYLTNAKLHNANNATAETPMAEGTVGGIIVGAIIGGVVVIGGIGTALYFCLRKKKEQVKAAKKTSNEKTVRLSKEQLAANKEEEKVATAVLQVHKTDEGLFTATAPCSTAHGTDATQEATAEEGVLYPMKTLVLPEPNDKEMREDPLDNTLPKKQAYFRKSFPEIKNRTKKLYYGLDLKPDVRICKRFWGLWKDEFKKEWFAPIDIVNMDLFHYFAALKILPITTANRYVVLFNCYANYNVVDLPIFTSFDDFKLMIKKIRSDKKFVKEMEVKPGDFTAKLGSAKMANIPVFRQLLVINELFKKVFDCFDRDITNPIIFLAPPSFLFCLALSDNLDRDFLRGLYYLMIYRASKAFPHVRALHGLQKHFPLGALAYCFYVQNDSTFADKDKAEEFVLDAKKKIEENMENLDGIFNLQVQKACQVRGSLIEATADLFDGLPVTGVLGNPVDQPIEQNPVKVGKFTGVDETQYSTDQTQANVSTEQGKTGTTQGTTAPTQETGQNERNKTEDPTQDANSKDMKK